MNIYLAIDESHRRHAADRKHGVVRGHHHGIAEVHHRSVDVAHTHDCRAHHEDERHIRRLRTTLLETQRHFRNIFWYFQSAASPVEAIAT